MQYNIRPALQHESPAIAALVNGAYRGTSSRAGWTSEADLLGGQRTDRDAIDELLSSPAFTLLVAEDPEGRLRGCVLLERRTGGTAYLGMLTVEPTIQAQGLGKRLLQEGEDYARINWYASAIEMTVISNRSELIAWYERRGYTRTGERRPFPMNDPRFGLPKVERLEFEVLRKVLKVPS